MRAIELFYIMRTEDDTFEVSTLGSPSQTIDLQHYQSLTVVLNEDDTLQLTQSNTDTLPK